MQNLWTVFLTGLVTGGVTCIVVQGGLLASLIASQKFQKPNSKYQIVFEFLTGKLVAYTIFGGLLGLLGSMVTFSSRFFGITQVLAGVYMLGVVAAILEIHPIFRYFLFQTPRSVGKVIRSGSKNGMALLVGALTVFIPCGTTQVMMVSAIGTGSAVMGAITMLVYILGTMPIFILLGAGVSVIGKLPTLVFSRLAAVGVVVIAVSSLNAGLVLMGSQVYPTRILREVYCAVSFCRQDRGNPVDVVAIEINSAGYSLDNTVIKAGQKITVNLKNTNGGGCQQAFSVPALNISKIVPMGESSQVTFTAPDKPGLLAFSCSMGMYSGQFTVVN